MPEHEGNQLKFAGITFVGKAGLGTFKVNEQQLGWSRADGNPTKYIGSDIESAEWLHACGRSRGLLQLAFKGDEPPIRLAGFKVDQLGLLKAHFQTHFGVTLEEQPLSTDGWNWCEWDLEDEKALRLTVNQRVGVDLPVSSLSQVTLLSNTELNLEFQPDPTVPESEEAIAEIRLVIPGSVGPNDSAEYLRDELHRLAGFSASGKCITRLSDIMMAAPRGKHDFEFFPNVVKVSGKTQSYSFKTAHVGRIFYLDQPGNKNVYVVLGLTQPLRAGKQTHPYLVLTVEKARTVPVDLPEEKLKLDKHQFTRGDECAVHRLLVLLLKDLTKKPAITCSTEFRDMLKSEGEDACIPCSHKAQAGAGYLYLLKMSMVFVPKPVFWRKYTDIASVSFTQAAMRRNTFDMVVRHKSSEPDVEFAQVESAVYDAVRQFLEKVGVTIEGEVTQQRASVPQATGSLTTRSGRAVRSSVSARGAAADDDDDYADDNDDADGDFEAADADDASSSEDGGDDLEDDEPKKKRARRAK